MQRRLIVAVLCVGFVVLFGPWTRANAGDHKKDDFDRHGKKSDFALFDGTNPATEAPPFGGAECTVKGPATFHVTVTAHSSGPPGFVRATFRDGDFVQFPIASDGSFSFSQSIGGTNGVDDRIRISNGGTGARLVGWVSARGQHVSCQSCNFDDAVGGTDCQNSP